MIVRTITSVKEFKSLEIAWRKLHAESPDSSFFNSFDFALVWWQVYGALGELSVQVVETSDASIGEPAVLAIAPMYKTRSNLSRLFEIPTLRFIGRGGDVTPDDLNVLLVKDQELAVKAVEQLQSYWLQSDDIQRVLLEDLPENARCLSLCTNPFVYDIEVRESRLVASLPDTWSEFKLALTRNSRKRLKHRLNRLKNSKDLTLAVCEDRTSMKNALAVLIKLHQERQNSKGESAAFSTNEYVKFHESLIDALHDKDALQFVTLSDGDEIVGVEYLFKHARSLLFYQTGFKPEYHRLSPGHNMMLFAIENAIENQFLMIDLLKGDYPYKRSYAAISVNSVSLSCYRSLRWRLLAKVISFAKKMR